MSKEEFIKTLSMLSNEYGKTVYMNPTTFEFTSEPVSMSNNDQDKNIELDVDIALLVQLLNQKGYHTTYSCGGYIIESQLYDDVVTSVSAYIGFDDWTDSTKLIEAILSYLYQIDKASMPGNRFKSININTGWNINFDKSIFEHLPEGWKLRTEVRYTDPYNDRYVTIDKCTIEETAIIIEDSERKNNLFDLYQFIETLPNNV